jgi:DNA invertase Pin-like site-specific DNA recombinase
MNIVIYRANRNISILTQEECIRDFALRYNIKVDDFYFDFSPSNATLEGREETKEFIRGLKEGVHVYVYDFWVLSSRAGELIKLFTCLLKKDAKIYNCKKDVVIDKNSPSLLSLGLLNDFREGSMSKSSSLKTGRPKGSISRSKFDKYKDEIVDALREGISISQIARDLKVNRSSLKDYIYSRSLKELSLEESSGAKPIRKELSNSKVLSSIKCPFKIQESKKGDSNG